jgi:hypothetical protein
MVAAPELIPTVGAVQTICSAPRLNSAGRKRTPRSFSSQIFFTWFFCQLCARHSCPSNARDFAHTGPQRVERVLPARRVYRAPIRRAHHASRGPERSGRSIEVRYEHDHNDRGVRVLRCRARHVCVWAVLRIQIGQPVNVAAHTSRLFTMTAAVTDPQVFLGIQIRSGARAPTKRR